MSDEIEHPFISIHALYFEFVLLILACFHVQFIDAPLYFVLVLIVSPQFFIVPWVLEQNPPHLKMKWIIQNEIMVLIYVLTFLVVYVLSKKLIISSAFISVPQW